MMEKLYGLIAASFTPMTQSGSIDYSVIPLLIELYKKNGVKGVFIGGSTGEGASLSYKERVKLIKVWGKYKTPDLSLIFMLGGTSVSEMKELAVLAEGEGINAISFLAPYYFRPANVKELVNFSKEIAESVPQVPLYFYHIPALTGGHYSMLEYLQLADEEIPNLAGIKYSYPNLMEYHACSRYKNGQYDLLWGIDEGLLSGLVIGAKGAVGSTYNYAAPLYNQIIDAFDNGLIKEAEEMQFKAVKMVQLLGKYGGIGTGKAIMKLIGIDCGWFRPPIQSLSDQELDNLRIDLDKICFFDFCSKF